LTDVYEIVVVIVAVVSREELIGAGNVFTSGIANLKAAEI
jgi:hypothetical protein